MLLTSSLRILMNSVNNSKSNLHYVSHPLPADSRKESVFVEISWATRHKREIKPHDHELKCSFSPIKTIAIMLYLFPGRGQLFFPTTISHLQVHDILPHTFKLSCLASQHRPIMLRGLWIIPLDNQGSSRSIPAF